ncbi:hypothetical protein [Pseudorhodobacter ferrugineus]|uniref:hypothetical protein n=1 Tax=Pseudorhodobacter ferrugineus TaxID=77008 RepID=UPI0003B534B4|nr:hypothetical protein [Pseudorhodobacter ferrugineus]
MTQGKLWPSPSTTPAETTATHRWIGVASADHVAIGRAQGFMQVCHDKGSPLRRIKPGRAVISYSPA